MSRSLASLFGKKPSSTQNVSEQKTNSESHNVGSYTYSSSLRPGGSSEQKLYNESYSPAKLSSHNKGLLERSNINDDTSTTTNNASSSKGAGYVMTDKPILPCPPRAGTALSGASLFWQSHCQKQPCSRKEQVMMEASIPSLPCLRKEQVMMEASIPSLPSSTIRSSIVLNNSKSGNGLECFVWQLKEKLIDRLSNPITENIYYGDTSCMLRIQSKFKELYKPWLKFMDVLQNLATELDTKYESKNYLGYKDYMKTDFLNIAVSFFIIGPESRSGNGINNLNGPGPIFIIDDSSKPTVRMHIESYFDAIMPTFEKIHDNQKSIMIFDSEHGKYKRQLDTINSNIGACQGSLKKQTKDLEKLVEDNQVEMARNSIKQIKKTLREYLDKKKVLEDKIDVIINKKKEIQNLIFREYDVFRNLLHFCYFFHEDYCSSIDSKLL